MNICDIDFSKVKDVTIGFENCEVWVVPVEHFVFISLDEVYSSIQINVQSNLFSNSIYAKKVTFALNEMGIHDLGGFDGDMELGTRLTAVCDKDVVDLTFTFLDGTAPLTVYVEWEPSSCDVNSYQKIIGWDTGDIIMVDIEPNISEERLEELETFYKFNTKQKTVKPTLNDEERTWLEHAINCGDLNFIRKEYTSNNEVLMKAMYWDSSTMIKEFSKEDFKMFDVNQVYRLDKIQELLSE